MKKILITFVFVLIMMALFLVPEVHASWYDDVYNTQVTESKSMEQNELKVVVMGFENKVNTYGNWMKWSQGRFSGENNNNLFEITEHKFKCNHSNDNYIAVFIAVADNTLDGTFNLSVYDGTDVVEKYGDKTNFEKLGLGSTERNRAVCMPLLNLDSRDTCINF